MLVNYIEESRLVEPNPSWCESLRFHWRKQLHYLLQMKICFSKLNRTREGYEQNQTYKTVKQFSVLKINLSPTPDFKSEGHVR